MRKFARFVSDVLSWIGNFQTLVGLLPAGVLSVVGGLSTYSTQGLGWGLFVATGIVAFLTFSYVIVRESYRANRLQHKLNISAVAMQQLGRDGSEVVFRPNFFLQNDANFEIFFELRSADYTFGSMRGSLDPTVPLRGLLAAKSGTGIVVPAMKGPHPLPQGRISISVAYGREKDEYTHLFVTNLECNALSIVPEEQAGIIDMTRLVRSLDYSIINK